MLTIKFDDSADFSSDWVRKVGKEIESLAENHLASAIKAHPIPDSKTIHVKVALEVQTFKVMR